MKINVKFLEEKRACRNAIDEFAKQINGDIEIIPLIQQMIDKKYQLDWANWLIVRCMTQQQYVLYAIYAAEQVIDIFEKKYPDDKRPRRAIEAAKKCAENPTAKNRKGAASAAASAAYAAYAAYAAAYAAYAAYASYADASSSYASASAAASASYAYADAAASASQKMRIKILEYGLKLLMEEKLCFLSR